MHRRMFEITGVKQFKHNARWYKMIKLRRDFMESTLERETVRLCQRNSEKFLVSAWNRYLQIIGQVKNENPYQFQKCKAESEKKKKEDL